MNKNRLVIFCCMGICIGVIAVCECFAGNLKVATLDYPPFQYKEDGEIKGIAADIIKEIFKRMNQPIEIKFYPFPRAVKNIRKGVSDVIFTFYYKKEREQFAEYSKESLVEQTISLFVHKDSAIVFDGNLSGLNQYKFGLVRFSYGKVFDEAVSNGLITNTDYVSEMGNNMKKFLKRRFDILPSDRWVALYYYSKIAPKVKSRFKELKPPVQTFPAYIGFSKANNLTSVRNRADDILRKMKEDGTYQKIINSHIDKWGIILDEK